MKKGTEKEDCNIINKLIYKQNIDKGIVSNIVFEYYDKNSHYEYTTSDFLNYLKQSYLKYLELIDTINIALNDEEIKQHGLLLGAFKELQKNVIRDTNELTKICKNLCSLYHSEIGSRSDSLTNLQKTTINSKDEKAILKNNLKDLLNSKTRKRIPYQIIKLSKFKLDDCIKNICKCNSFYKQLLSTMNNLVNLCKGNSRNEKKAKSYLNLIIKELKKDHDSLRSIENNLIYSYC